MNTEKESVLFNENEDLNKMVKFMDIKSKIDTMNETRTKLKTQSLSVISDEDKLNALYSKVVEKGINEKDIRTLTNEQITEIYTFDGELLNLIHTENVDPKVEFEFKRDFLAYEVGTKRAFEEMDAAEVKLAAELQEYEDEMKDVLENFGSLIAGLRAKLVSAIEKETDLVKKERLSHVLESLDDATNLTRIIECYEKLSPFNQIYNYKNSSQRIFNKFMEKLKVLKVKADLSVFSGLEPTYLPEKYHQYSDLFLFMVMQHISHIQDKNLKKESEGIFITQLVYNLNSLFKGNMIEEEKTTFLGNIQKCLDLIYGGVQ
jgi:hypothetical protein